MVEFPWRKESHFAFQLLPVIRGCCEQILIAVVIGALLLGGLYALFNSTIMPTVTAKIQELFNYAG